MLTPSPYNDPSQSRPALWINDNDASEEVFATLAPRWSRALGIFTFQLFSIPGCLGCWIYEFRHSWILGVMVFAMFSTSPDSIVLDLEISGCTSFWIFCVRNALTISRSRVLILSQITTSPKCRCCGHWPFRQMWNLVLRHCDSSGIIDFASAGFHKIYIVWVLNCCGCVYTSWNIDVSDFSVLRNSRALIW